MQIWHQMHKCMAIYLLVRFLALVTTMVTKVDHGNYRSNDRVVVLRWLM